MKWLTNCPKKEANDLISKWMVGNPNRKIVVGDPIATECFTVAELKESDGDLIEEWVGLYDA